MTNDGATILSLLDIEHPAGKILVDLAQQQDKEVSFTTWSLRLLGTTVLIKGFLGRRWHHVRCSDRRRAVKTSERIDKEPDTPYDHHQRLQACSQRSCQIHEREHHHKSRDFGQGKPA